MIAHIAIEDETSLAKCQPMWITKETSDIIIATYKWHERKRIINLCLNPTHQLLDNPLIPTLLRIINSTIIIKQGSNKTTKTRTFNSHAKIHPQTLISFWTPTKNAYKKTKYEINITKHINGTRIRRGGNFITVHVAAARRARFICGIEPHTSWPSELEFRFGSVRFGSYTKISISS